jgi:hypothetical protein
MATTDGCIAMAIIAMDLFNINPITSDFLVHANAYGVYNLKEWSALKIKEFLDKNKIEKSDKPLHIITDMEADDLTALRIFANFYNDITIYITLHESAPRVSFDTAKNFFKRLNKKKSRLQTWVGELYLELHRGTLTTHGLVKKQNRKLENKLKAVEFLWSCADLKLYPSADLDTSWKKLLINQFHDIIPGSNTKVLVDRRLLRQ